MTTPHLLAISAVSFRAGTKKFMDMALDEPILIVGDKGDCVLMSIDKYEELSSGPVKLRKNNGNKGSKYYKVMDIIERYGQIDGSHHKQWCLDQIARIIKGDDYDAWVKEMLGEKDSDGCYEYDYDEGIPP